MVVGGLVFPARWWVVLVGVCGSGGGSSRGWHRHPFGFRYPLDERNSLHVNPTKKDAKDSHSEQDSLHVNHAKKDAEDPRMSKTLSMNEINSTGIQPRRMLSLHFLDARDSLHVNPVENDVETAPVW
ncbi:hypothetical protein V8G54_009351 [Vigna mungo]|uniref:Secreted protein n=1 Tax=Vigna mungo TaxID=3915 RepID=A0AAQ3S5E0_VIGMU